jgi:hypothetical protein
MNTSLSGPIGSSSVGTELGMELGEFVEELLDGRRRDVELGDAPRQLREVADQNNPRHFRLVSSSPPSP